ncbi:MAG: 50S ribosomal protein L21 [Chloroflexi bacterium CFX7]|nr:50S ribosomal protein L21 [Chloroflexi bacterium CFX7]MCK6565404.1 50S ribosomal protein L21 [Dehalococcoidia bacterium]MCL4231927.1 50S ribosomal protein L21 [Dehalococcoidia bacterium]RIL01949.1 MAG: 50S ribosomal protein L21 [bacterium]
MEAIIRADGRQMRLVEGQEFEVSHLAGEPGDSVSFDVLMLLDGADVTVGQPVVSGAALTARIAQHGKAPKIRFMKYKNKVRYRRILGHRQPVTRLVVETISKG